MTRRRFLLTLGALVAGLYFIPPALAKHNHGTTKYRRSHAASLNLGLLGRTR